MKQVKTSPVEETKTSDDTLQLNIPKPNFKLQSFTPVLVILLIIASFFLGSFYTKVQYLEKSGQVAGAATNPQQAGNQQPNNPPAPSYTNDDIKKWAEDTGLNKDQFNNCLDAKKFQAEVDKDASDGRAVGVSGTPTFYVNGIQLVGAQPYPAFKEILDKALNGEQLSGTPVQVDNGHLPVLGSANAKVTVIEFSDLECPFCRRFYQDTFPQIKKDYIDTGKIAFYFRHFPLDFHPMAVPFANAAECANDQEKFWEFHDKIEKAQGSV